MCILKALGSLNDAQLNDPDTKLKVKGTDTTIELGSVYTNNFGNAYYSVNATPTDPAIFVYESNGDGSNTITITGIKSEYVSTYYKHGTYDKSTDKTTKLVIPYEIDRKGCN